MGSKSSTVQGYRGEIFDAEILPEGVPSLPRGPDLVKMAEQSLVYLTRNPDPKHNYDSRFTFFPHLCPPFAPSETANLQLENWKIHYERAPHIDPVAIGDTESRNDIAFNLMREMTGSDYGREVQEIVHRRLVGYVRSGSGKVGDDLSWVVPYCSFCHIDEGPYAMVWTTGMLLHSESDLYRLTGDEAHRRLARRLFEGLRRVAHWDTGRAFYPFGGAAFNDEKSASASLFSGVYPSVISPIAHYWQSCGDPEALKFAQAMAEGFVSDLQPGHQHKSDGHIHGHTHSQMHAVRGVAHLGSLTQDWHFLDWAKTAYDFSYAAGFDTGWVPEVHWNPDHRTHSETCVIGDMLEMAVWFARAGQPRFWDRVDRTVRNYLVPAQFSLTPEFKAFWHEINSNKSPAEIKHGLAGLRELEGSFLSSFLPNDLAIEVHSEKPHPGVSEFRGHRILVEMAGCCPPSAMRALNLAWSNTVLTTSKGVMVNLPFDHDGTEAKVVSEMPRKGHLHVTPKVKKDFWLRPPSWAPRDQVEALRNGKRSEPHWGGPAIDYVAFPNAKVGETLELTWPLVRFKQRVTQRYMENSEEEVGRFVSGDTYTYYWTGSTVTGVEPQGKWLPMYGKKET
jgi:hypothetical protein